MTFTPIDGPVFNVVTNTSSDKQTDRQSDDGSEDDEDAPDPLCCLEGCLTGVVAAVLFLIVIPAGVILSIYACSSDSKSILAVGIILVITPIISAPIFVAIVFNRRRLKRLRKNQVGHLSEAAPEKF